MPGRAAAVRFISGTVAALAVTASLAAPAQAQQRLNEHHVKAAFLYNFLKFIEWPPSDDRPQSVIVCVVGERDPIIEFLEIVARGKRADGHEMVVRRLRDEDDPQDCHIVFIGVFEARRTADIIKRVGNAAVLTVGETPSFLSEGGIARFYVHDNRVRFQVNSAGATQAGLKISSQLLSLAK